METRRRALISEPGRAERARDLQPCVYQWPESLEAYLPDPTEPGDRWYQAGNASNPRTTLKILDDLCPAADLLIDPLCGSGSSAWAARLRGLPFFGVELDPVLACVSVAKARASVRDAELLVEAGRVEGTAEPICSARAPDSPSPIAPCLAVTATLSQGTEHPTQPSVILEDLAVSPSPHELNTVVWADATDEGVWADLYAQPGPLAQARHAVIYASPPFGLRSPRPRASLGLYGAAVRTLTAVGVAHARSRPAEFPAYEEIAASVVGNVARLVPRVTVVLEHEPADDGQDARRLTAERLLADLGHRVGRLRILESAVRSGRGAFSLITCEIQA